MSVDRQQLRHLAALAGLDLEPAEEEALAAELGRIVEYVHRIGEAGEGPPAPPPAPREEADAPRPPLPAERVLAAAPQTDGALVRVPPLLPAAPEGGRD